MGKRDVALPDIKFLDGSIEHVIDLLAIFEDRHTMLTDVHLKRDSSGVKIIAKDSDDYEYIISRTDPPK